MSLSLIALLATTLHLPCRQVFVDTVLLHRPTAAEEMPKLREFADASCKTNNPDLLWQVAYVESGFRFSIATLNKATIPYNGKKPVVLEGREAGRHLERLAQTTSTQSGHGGAQNVDVGVLQINWGYHAESFGFSPNRMLSPAAQVSYIIDNMMPGLYERCGTKWVGCYHSADSRRAGRYSAMVDNAKKRLKVLTSKVAKLRGAKRWAYVRDGNEPAVPGHG